MGEPVRHRGPGRRGRRCRSPNGAFERLERRIVLDGAGPRPFIDLGPSDNVALDQPRVTVEFGDSLGRSIGPDIFNSWLLDTGANTVLAFQTAIDDMNGTPPSYQVEGAFEEIGVGGSQLFDISAPYRLDFAGASGVRQSIPDARIISDATRDVSMFGPFGIVGMPAMTGRVTTLDFTPWLSPGEDNLLMACDFSDTMPAPAGSRYTVSVDDRVAFSPDGQVVEGDFPPVWADVPFLGAEVVHGGRTVAGDFMFDTGAQVSIISTETALALGLDTNGDGALDSNDSGYARGESVGGVGGSRDAPVFMIDAVHLPTLEGVDLVWHDLQWLVADIAPGIDGVFGFDNVTTGWIDAVFSSGGSGAIRQVQLDFRGWDDTGRGAIAFDVAPDLAAVQLPSGPGGVVVEPGGSTTVSESGVEDTYTFVLRTKPTADVVVDLVTPASQVVAFATGFPLTTSLRFTPADWDVPRSVTVRAVDDATQQSLHRSSVRHVAHSDDPSYDGVGMPRVLVNVVDDDFPAVMILPTDGETDVVEGATDDTYSLVLTQAPGQDVRVVLVAADAQITAAAAVDGAGYLLFTPTNWNLPQAVRVTAVDDGDVEGPHRSRIDHVIESGDAGYAEAYVLPEQVFVTDDDVARPPVLGTAAAAVQGVVGSAITVGGTWGSPDAGHSVSLSASLGSVTLGGDGTWVWSLLPAGVLGRETVTITAVDDRGLGARTSFTVTARAAATDPVAVAGEGAATLSWTPPAAPPGLPVTGWRIETSLDGGQTWTRLADGTTSVPPMVVTGLENGKTHRFRVAATDADGVGPWSAPSNPVVPATAPASPTSLLAAPGDRKVSLSWSLPPTDGGAGIAGYVVQSSADGGRTWSTLTRTVGTTATATGLTNGRSYVYRVAAVNAVGQGAFTAASPVAIPAKPAGVPGALAVTRGDGQVRLTWRVPSSDGGSPITDYAIEASTDAGRTWVSISRPASTATSATVVGLENGIPHVFRVAAVNSVGPAAFTAKSAPVVPAGLPGVPTALVAARGNRQVTLQWTAPETNGGLTITDWAVRSSVDDGRTWKAVAHKVSSSASLVVTGLANGTGYRFRVAAVNAVGVGPLGEASAMVVPATVAAAPTAPVVTRGDGQVAVTWRSPASNGGAAILDYVLQASADGGRTWTPVAHEAAPATSLVAGGLVNGRAYLFRVAAVNAVGTGPWSAPSPPATPAALPGRPRALSASSVAGRTTVTWSAPDVDGGATIVDYSIQWSADGGKTWVGFAHKPSAATTARLSGLPPSGILFRVAARNAVGVGAFVQTASVS